MKNGLRRASRGTGGDRYDPSLQEGVSLPYRISHFWAAEHREAQGSDSYFNAAKPLERARKASESNRPLEKETE